MLVRLSLVLGLGLTACTSASEERASGLEIPTDEALAAPTPITGPTQVVGATLRHVADVPGPLTAHVAFGADGVWWHWDGEHATAFIDGVAQPDLLDAAALLAASPQPPVDRPLAIGSTLLTAAGPRPLQEKVVYALEANDGPWGYFDRGATFSPEGALLVLTQEWRPSGCCREGEHERQPPRNVAHFFDTATGIEHERIGVSLPVVIGRERVLLGGTFELLHNREPLYPLDSHTIASYSARALALGVDESVIASAVLANGPRLALFRARDGVQLHEWEAPPDTAALAFHPTQPLLAAAGSNLLELWRVDTATPTRLAKAPLAEAPAAISFHPDGHRLVLTGQHGVVFELALDVAPADQAPTALALALQRDDPSIPPLRAGNDVSALMLDEGQVHAYGRGHGLYSFDRSDGHRLRSWLRRDDDDSGVTFAARAPVFAAAERHPLGDDEPSRRVDVIDARTYATVATTYLSRGELAHLVLSPRGTTLAWALKDDAVVTLQGLDGHSLLYMNANSTNVEAIAISDDDRMLAVANRHVTKNVFVGTVGETTVRAITTPRGVSRLSFARDGKRLFVVDFDGKIHVVDPVTGRMLDTFDPKAGASGELAETPDGRHLVYARESVVVLDAATGAEVTRFPVLAWIRSLALALDGHGVATGDTTGEVHLLTIP